MTTETDEERRARLAEKAKSDMAAAMGAPRVGLGRPSEHPESSQDQPVERAVPVDPKSIFSLPENDRLMPPPAPERLEALRESIRKNGIRVPLVCDSQTRITVCGNNRLSIALTLGLPSVPVIWRNIPEADRQQYAIRDNVERRQLTEDEISAVIAPYLSGIPARVEATKKARIDALVARRRGETPETIPSAYAETADLIQKEVGIKISPEALRKKVTSPKKGRERTASKKSSPHSSLRKPIFDDKKLKMVLYFPSHSQYEKAKNDFSRHFKSWEANRKEK